MKTKELTLAAVMSALVFIATFVLSTALKSKLKIK